MINPLPSRRIPARGAILNLALFLILSVLPFGLQAQGNRAPPVRFTEVQERQVQRSVSLPGTVEAFTSSLVASEIAGKVVEYPVKEGDAVRKGQVLARLNTTTLEHQLKALEAEHREAGARLKLAEANLKRARNLFESEIISEQQLDNSLAESNAWMGRFEKLEADIGRLKNDIQEASIRAPFSGRVVSEQTQIGEWISEGGPVVEMVALDPLEVKVDVPERYYRNLRIGTRAQVRFESLPGVEIMGRVTAIIPQADVDARTYPVKVRIRNRGARVGVGMLATVSFPAGDTYTATLVPKDAVTTRGPQKFIYRINGQSTVERVSVEIGVGVGEWIEVRGGDIRPGQRVITRGNERLVPGQPVQAQPLEYALP